MKITIVHLITTFLAGFIEGRIIKKIYGHGGDKNKVADKKQEFDK